jgi:hypothetical protein
MRWAGHVARMWAIIHLLKVLVRKPEGRRLLERPKRKCNNNIRMYLREIDWVCVDWINLAQDSDQWQALVNTIMNLQGP